MKKPSSVRANRYLLASDFDRTLSFNDSGEALAELHGVAGFDEKIAELAEENFVQQGGELAYLLVHDPEFNGVRRDHLVQAGKSAQLKENVELLPKLLNQISDRQEFVFYVISAAPREVVQSALEGIVPPERVFGTEFEYDSDGQIVDVKHCTAGYGKVAVLDQLREQWNVRRDRIIYVGDGSSDIHVMLHVNRLDGLTIAVSENPYIRPVARRIVLSEDALAVAVPILEEVFGWDAARIQTRLESEGFLVREWEKLETDTLVLRPAELEVPNGA
ncbi:MAG: HAD-IB family phosphatase [Gemmatimonadales bacterium]|jgi:HAD superfamily phosphoserine phosphatase-like hydrolase